MLINTPVLVFCVGSFRFCRGNPKESCYQPILHSSQALKKDTLKQPESPGQVGRLSSPVPGQKPPRTKAGIVHSARYLLPGLRFAIVPPDPGSQSFGNAPLAPPLTGSWVWELLPATGCPQNLGSLRQRQCFSACVCVLCGGGCYSAVFLEPHLSQEYKIRQAKQTWIICFPKDQGFSGALAVPLSYRIYHCKDTRCLGILVEFWEDAKNELLGWGEKSCCLVIAVMRRILYLPCLFLFSFVLKFFRFTFN